MSFVQEDGKGRGFKAEIDESNRAVTYSIIRCDCADNSLRLGQSYEFATGAFIPLVSGVAENAIIYIKNTSTTRRLHIHELRTCGTNTIKWTLYKNDDGGTIITDENPGTKVNHNFSSSNQAEADVWAASTSGVTRSGGVWMSQHIDEEGHSESTFEGAVILGQSDSLTLTAALKTASIGQECCVRIHGYYEVVK